MSKKGIENLNKTMSGLGGEIKKSTAAEKKGVTKTLKPDILKNETQTKPDDISKKGIDTNTKLNTNLLKLNQSITLLTAAVKKSGGVTGSGGGNIPGRMPLGGGDSAGFGGMGASIPIAGAAIALTGFVIQKVNQIGNAYIERTSQQAKSVGVGGFRRGEGMYNAAEIGAGMQAYGMASGKFAQGIDPEKAAIQSGNIFGLSSGEVLGQAGTFARTGADYQKALYTGAGAGMETELPRMMQVMGQTLEEAVKNGVNTSDLSKDLGLEMASLTMATTTKSVDAAVKIAQAAGISKSKAAMGQMENIEDLFVWRGAQEELLASLNASPEEKEKKLAYMEERGLISFPQKHALGREKKITAETLVGMGGEELLVSATEDVAESMSEYKAAKKIEKGYMGMDENMSINRMEMLSKAFGGMGKNLRSVSLAKDQDFSGADVEGKKKIETWEKKKVLETAPAMGVMFERTKENDILTYGKEFAQATIEMDAAMRNLAKVGMNVATSSITTMGEAATKLQNSFAGLTSDIEKIKEKGLLKSLFD
jgi:hypothetical protein